MNNVCDVILIMSNDGEDALYTYLENDAKLESKVIDFLYGHELHNLDTEDHVWVWRNIDCDMRTNIAIETLSRMKQYIHRRHYQFIMIPKDPSMVSSRVPWDQIFESLRE